MAPDDLKTLPDAPPAAMTDLLEEVPKPPAGQLGTFAALGAAAGSVPLPWVPDAIAKRLRGALVQDIAARHGRGLSPAARALLADPAGEKKRQRAIAQAFSYLGKKVLARFGPLAIVAPLRGALATYVLGHLFDRYLARSGRECSGRVEVAEARRVRDAMDRAVLGLASPERGLRWPGTPTPPEDTRDELTQVLDGLLSATSLAPSWLQKRLDEVFDLEIERR